ncbi:MAG: YdaS family helix-turn-helix protein [Bacillota bacterium]
MDILEIAIKTAGGTGRLAYMLDVKQSVVSNWRRRGVPKAWEQVLRYKYKKQIAEAQKMV